MREGTEGATVCCVACEDDAIVKTEAFRVNAVTEYVWLCEPCFDKYSESMEAYSNG
jgi:hypothetical protein